MDVYKIVKKLIGEIIPVGQTEVDSKRMDNLKVTCELIKDLTEEVICVSKERGDEWSIKNARKYATLFLDELSNKNEAKQLKDEKDINKRLKEVLKIFTKRVNYFCDGGTTYNYSQLIEIVKKTLKEANK